VRTNLTRVCVRGGVVTPTSGRANGLNMPPPLKFMTSTTFTKEKIYIHKKELKKKLIQITQSMKKQGKIKNKKMI
jgi:hypothetical protein